MAPLSASAPREAGETPSGNFLWVASDDSPTIQGLIPPNPQVPNFYVLFSVIAVAAAIIWASRQGKPSSSADAGRRPPVDAKPPHPMGWLGCSLFGIVFVISGIAMCLSPWTPTGGGKGRGVFCTSPTCSLATTGQPFSSWA